MMARKTTDSKSKRHTKVKDLPKPKAELTSKQVQKVRGGQTSSKLKWTDVELKRG